MEGRLRKAFFIMEGRLRKAFLVFIEAIFAIVLILIWIECIMIVELNLKTLSFYLCSFNPYGSTRHG
jgi:hypothetical protein